MCCIRWWWWWWLDGGCSGALCALARILSLTAIYCTWRTRAPRDQGTAGAPEHVSCTSSAAPTSYTLLHIGVTLSTLSPSKLSLCGHICCVLRDAVAFWFRIEVTCGSVVQLSSRPLVPVSTTSSTYNARQHSLPTHAPFILAHKPAPKTTITPAGKL